MAIDGRPIDELSDMSQEEGRHSHETPKWWDAHLTPALPIGSADSADAERGKRTQRLGGMWRCRFKGSMRELLR